MMFCSVSVQRHAVTVELTAQECEIIADSCRDGSTPENPSVCGMLSDAFRALATVSLLSGKGA